MSSTHLLEPILEHGIRNPHFFEGRLLTGRDLRDQQLADRTHHRYLGRATGAGVIEGLEVEITPKGSDGLPSKVNVTRGLALTAKGDILELSEDKEITLTKRAEVSKGSGTLFSDCKIPSTFSIANGTGVYVLVMSPSSGFEERAPKSGLGGERAATGCGSRYEVEGVQFRTVQLDRKILQSIATETSNLLLDDLLNENNPVRVTEKDRLSKLRNILAHLCYGTEKLKLFAADPFARENGNSSYVNYGVLDRLRMSELLNDCDVPLALFYWANEGIAFLDLWSVRRRPYALNPSNNWPTLISPRRLAEAEAMFFQFQEHLAQITEPGISQSQLVSIEVDKYFRYLPGAGMIPVTISSLRQYHREKAGKIPAGLTGQDRGFDYQKFYNNMTFRDPVIIEGAKIESIFRKSLMFQPINSSNVDTSNEEMISLYFVRENVESIIKDGTSQPQPYLIFTNGHMPFYGEAKYDISRWDYSNYSNLKCNWR